MAAANGHADVAATLIDAGAVRQIRLKRRDYSIGNQLLWYPAGC